VPFSKSRLVGYVCHVCGKLPHRKKLFVRNLKYSRLKMAAAAEHRTVKGFTLSLIEERIQDLENGAYCQRGRVSIATHSLIQKLESIRKFRDNSVEYSLRFPDES
jgi:hypothetical protein